MSTELNSARRAAPVPAAEGGELPPMQNDLYYLLEYIEDGAVRLETKRQIEVYARAAIAASRAQQPERCRANHGEWSECQMRTIEQYNFFSRQVTSPMCERKTADIMQREGYQKTGYVLMKDDPAERICVSDQGAVSWFTREQWQWLMHGRDHVEFQWPKPVGAAPSTTQTTAQGEAELTLTGSAVLAELRGQIKEMQEAAYTYGDYSTEAVRVALDGVLDAIDELTTDQQDSAQVGALDQKGGQA